MAQTTFIDKQKNALIKKYHALAGKAGMDTEALEAFLSGYGVASSKDLNVYELMEACHKLELLGDPGLKALDMARKRLMAAIGGWLRLTGVPCNGAKIKAIACRASKRTDFNDIPMEQLRNLYAAFNKKQRDWKQVGEVTDEVMNYLSSLN